MAEVAAGSRWRRAASRLALAAASALAAVAIVDLVASCVLDRKPPGYGQQRYFQYSFLTGFAHAPRAEGTHYRYEDGTRVHVRINRYGFSDADRSLEKQRPRIALIGDSTTQAWEVEEPERPHVVLEELLDGRYEVLDLGVRAFGTDQTYLMFREVGVHFAPDIVVYTFCVNDLSDNTRSDGKPYFVLDPKHPGRLLLRGYPVAAPEPRQDRYYYWLGLAKHSFVFRRAYHLASLRFRAPTPLAEHFELRPYKVDYDDVDTQRMQVTLALIGELQRLTADRGMRFLVVEGIYRHVYDAAAQARIRELYGDRFDFDKVSRSLAEHAQRSGIALLSLPRRWRSQAVAIESVMHVEDNIHLNARGLRLQAEALRDELEARGWLEAVGGRGQ